MHRGIGFNREQFEHSDRTGPANPRQIIAQKIHNHQIFGAVFWICGKKITVCLICHGAAHPGWVPFIGRLCIGPFELVRKKTQATATEYLETPAVL